MISQILGNWIFFYNKKGLRKSLLTRKRFFIPYSWNNRKHFLVTRMPEATKNVSTTEVNILANERMIFSPKLIKSDITSGFSIIISILCPIMIQSAAKTFIPLMHPIEFSDEEIFKRFIKFLRIEKAIKISLLTFVVSFA